MIFDSTMTPFSRAGSFLSVRAGDDHLLIRDVHGSFGDQSRCFELRFEQGGSAVPFSVEATPWLVTVRAGGGLARLVLRGRDELLVESEGLDLHWRSLLGPFGHGYANGRGRFFAHIAADRRSATLTTIQGLPEPDVLWEEHGGRVACTRADLHVRARDGRARVVLATAAYADEVLPEAMDLGREQAEARRDWEVFLAGMPEVAPDRRPGAELAWYTIWSCYVPAGGLLAYDAVLMSKNWMTSVWSWDHCFNALALGLTDPRAGMEQLLLPFERQLPSGALPDCINDSGAVYVSVKPPIHGWCLLRLMEWHTFGQETLRKIYGQLEAWTEWWLAVRDFDGDGVPNYVMSNESGADNASIFDPGQVLESPDLSAFLVLQLHALATVATALGEQERAAGWTRRAAALQERLIDHLWVGDRFVARVSGTDSFDPRPTSLLAILPLVLGEHLDPERFDLLVRSLEQDYLTAFGVASEMPAGGKYVSAGGYGMRGPIWAPYMYLLADGLRRGGRRDLAVRLAERFCATVERSGSMWENFDALTGEGRNDPAYTWTASVHLLLLHEYLR